MKNILLIILLLFSTLSAKNINIYKGVFTVFDCKVEMGTYGNKVTDYTLLSQNDSVSVISGEYLENRINIATSIITIMTYSHHFKISVKTKFTGNCTFKDGFGIIVHNSLANSVEVSNHKISDTTYLHGSMQYLEGYNSYTFTGSEANIPNAVAPINSNTFSKLFFPNPYHALVTSGDITKDEKHLFIQQIPEMKNIEKYTLNQEMMPGDSCITEFYIAKNNSKYFSLLSSLFFTSQPKGLSESVSMIWDEIPMSYELYTFTTFTVPEQTPHEVYRKMLEYLEEYNHYNCTFIISFDYVDPYRGGNELRFIDENIDFPSLIRGPYNLRDFAPDSFKTWLNDIENNSKYPWTPKVDLGFHALHHTYIDNGNVKDGGIHEFNKYNNANIVLAFDEVFDALPDLHITEESMKTLRFPGINGSNFANQEAIKRGFTFIDIGGRYNTQGSFNMGPMWGSGKKAWGFVDAHWTDTDAPSSRFSDSTFAYRLNKGIPILAGGHPNATVGNKPYSNGDEAIRAMTFGQWIESVKSDYEDGEFILAKELSEYVLEMSNIHNYDISFTNDSTITASFSGTITKEETYFADNNIKVKSVEYNGSPVSFKKKRSGTYIPLPKSSDTLHTLTLHTFPIDSTYFEDQNAEYGDYTILAYPTPFKDNVTIQVDNTLGNHNKASVVITDIHGNIVYTGNKRTLDKFRFNDIIINGLKLSRGVYIFHIYLDDTIYAIKQYRVN